MTTRTSVARTFSVDRRTVTRWLRECGIVKLRYERLTPKELRLLVDHVNTSNMKTLVHTSNGTDGGTYQVKSI
jgi:hypothetical protein